MDGRSAHGRSARRISVAGKGLTIVERVSDGGGWLAVVACVAGWLVGWSVLVCAFVCAFVSAFVCSFRGLFARVSCPGLRF